MQQIDLRELDVVGLYEQAASGGFGCGTFCGLGCGAPSLPELNE